MKNFNLKVIILSAYVLSALACSRPTTEKASLKIQFPELMSENLSKEQTYVEKILESVKPLSSGDVTAYGGGLGITPTGFTGTYPINCYAVMVSGPEPELRRNICKRRNDTTFAPRFAGPFVGGVPSGGKIELDVPAGQDRVVMIAGFYSQNGACKDFRAGGVDEMNITKPYLLGEVGHVNLPAGQVTEVPVPMTFDASNWFDGCDGPDFPSGPGGSNGPYLRLEGIGRWNQSLNKDIATVGKCYSVRAALYENMISWPNRNTLPINISLSGVTSGTFYSDDNCSTSVSSISIGVGASQSTQFYFKPTASGSNLSLPVTISNALSSISVQQSWDFGLPKLVVVGPPKVATNACIPYTLQRELFEGGSFAPLESPSVTLTDNASFYLRASSDCATGTQATITTSMDRTQVYFKLMSAIPVDIGAALSATGYQPVSRIIQNAAGNNVADSIQVEFTKTPLELGGCHEAKVRLVNFDGGALPAKYPFDIKLKVPQAAGNFYSMSNCNGTVSDIVSFAAGDVERSIYLRVFGTTNTSIPVFAEGGGFRLHGVASNLDSKVDMSVSSPASGNSTSDPWFLFISPPFFNGAEIVGDHEFLDGGAQTYKKIPLYFNANSGEVTSIDCSSNGFTWAPCTGEVDRTTVPYSYKWQASDAVSGTARYVRVLYTNSWGTGDRMLRISPEDLYGTNFKVVGCNAIASGGGGQTIESVNSNHPSTHTLCFPGGATYTRSSGTTKLDLTDTGFWNLIGHSSLTTVLDGSSLSGPLISVASGFNLDTSGNVVVANFKFQNLNSTGVQYSNPVALSPKTVLFNNINLDSSGLTSGSAISVGNSDPEINLEIKNLSLNVPDNVMGLDILGSSRNILVNSATILTAGANSKGVNAALNSGGGVNLIFDHLNIVTGGGVAFDVSSGTVALSNGALRNSKLEVTGVGADNAVVRISENINGFDLVNNRISSSSGAINNQLIYLYTFTHNLSNIVIRGNMLREGYSSGVPVALETNSTTISADISDNSVAYTGVGATSQVVFDSLGGSGTKNIQSVAATSSDLTGNNRVCSASSNTFANITAGSITYVTNGSYTVNLAGINQALNNVDANSGRCK